MAADIELLGSFYTLAGNVVPLSPCEVSPVPFETRAEAAAEAGYKGLGLLHEDLVAVRDRLGLKEMRRILDANGLPYVELEMLADWWASGAERTRSDLERRDHLEAAQALGARNLKVACEFGATEIDVPQMRDEFLRLCEEAQQYGTRIALEPMPFGNISNLETAYQVVDGAEAFGGGLLIDIWHMTRGGIPYSAVAEIPSQLLVSVELDDADADVQGTLLDDTIHYRKLCGEGSFDFKPFITAIRNTGFRDFYSVELMSKQLRGMPIKEAARRSYETAIRQFSFLNDAA